MSRPISTVKIVRKDDTSNFIKNKKINDLKQAMRELENCKNGNGKDTKLAKYASNTFTSLKRLVNTAMVIGPVGEAASLAVNMITGSFFKHYDSYFQNRIKDAIKSQDLVELQETKREAAEIRNEMLRYKSNVQDPKKKKLIQERIDNLDKKISLAEKQINSV